MLRAGAHPSGTDQRRLFDGGANNLYANLVELLRNIKNQGYKFVTVTPVTHQRFMARTVSPGANLRDIFGWSLPFDMAVLPPQLREIMMESNLLESCDSFSSGEKKYWKSKLRIASLGGDLFLHSAFPTTEEGSVFFGPDTYRFARFIRQKLERFQFFSELSSPGARKPLRILDIGCGSGAGGIAVVRALHPDQPYTLTMNDINPVALDYTRINSQVAEIPVEILPGNVLEKLRGKFDLIVANPPFMSDALGRAYRDGGAQLGLDLSQRIVKTAFEHLAPGGRLLLYTGVAMTGQSDPFLACMAPLLAYANCVWSYEEIDPDIFGDELEQPAYAKVQRIAAVGLVVTRAS